MSSLRQLFREAIWSLDAKGETEAAGVLRRAICEEDARQDKEDRRLDKEQAEIDREDGGKRWKKRSPD